MIPRQISQTVASVDGSQSNGKPIRVDGHQVVVDCQFPASLGLVQGSNDLTTWTSCTSRVDGSTALTSLADGTHNEVYERFKWMRPAVADDSSAVRNFMFLFTIQEDVNA